jgi:hypothetical protein
MEVLNACIEFALVGLLFLKSKNLTVEASHLSAGVTGVFLTNFFAT